MKTYLNSLALFLLAGIMFIGCQKADEAQMDAAQPEAKTTRAFGDKTPIIATYVEINDVNPLNAACYKLPDGKTYVDIVEFFASNLNKETVNGQVRPVLYLNDKMTHILEPEASAPTTTGYHKYVQGLQDLGIKVVLTVLPNWQNIDFTSMNDTQADQFATILAYAVEKYGLDGIGFDNEYGGSVTTVSGSFGNIIKKLRAKLPAGKLITLFQYNLGYNQIDATAGAMLDYVYANFGWNTSIGVPGVTKAHYAPLSINLGSISSVSYYGDKAYDAAEGGYGAIMHFNLRKKSDVDPTSLFKAIADGAWAETNVTCPNGSVAQEQTFEPNGFSITYADATAN